MSKELPKDLGVKIGSKAQAYWAEIVKDTKDQIERIDKQLIFLKAVLEMSEENMVREQKAWESKS